MKPSLIALLALCLCLVVAGAEKKKQAGFKAIKPVRSTELARSSNPSELDPTKPLPKGFKSLKALAVKGDAKAQYELGGEYYYGEGIEKEKKEAIKWYRKAAEQGDAYGQS